MAAVKIKKEIVVILYYAVFITAILTVDRFIPGGRHGPGFSLLIIMLFVPLSIGYFIMQLATLGRDNHKCIYIHLAVWVALFLWIYVF
jgi:hypothetical protein